MKTLVVRSRKVKSRKRVLHPLVQPDPDQYISHTCASYVPERTHCGLLTTDEWRVAKGHKVVTCPICWFRSHGGRAHKKFARNSANQNEPAES